MIEIIGYWFCVIAALSALAALAGLTALVAYWNILASKYFLAMMGGWQCFNEFKKWRKDNPQEAL